MQTRRWTDLSRRAGRPSSVLLLFLTSGEDLLSREEACRFLGGVADLDRDLERDRSRRLVGFRLDAGGVVESSRSRRRRGGVTLVSALLDRRGGVRDGDLDLDLDLDRERDMDLPLVLTELLSFSSKYRPRRGLKSGFLSRSLYALP